MKLNLLEIIMSEIPAEKEEKKVTGDRFKFLKNNLASTRQINNGSSAFLDGNRLYAIMPARNHPGKFYVRYRYEDRVRGGMFGNEKDPYKVLGLVDSYSDAIKTIKDYVNKQDKKGTNVKQQVDLKKEYIEKIKKNILNLNTVQLNQIIKFMDNLD